MNLKSIFVHKKIYLFPSIFLILLLLLFFNVKDSLYLLSPAPTQLIQDRNGYFLSESNVRSNEEIGYWPVSDPLPQKVKLAIIYAEDHRFYSHFGIDLYALFRAVIQNLQGYPRQGASTIPMQVARMQEDQSRTYWNKFREMIIATGLIIKYGHDGVLNQYLKLMPQGNRIHGISYSARRYFRKPLKDLNWAEVSLLSAIPKAPGRMNLFSARGFKRASKRADLILSRLKKHGVIDNPTWKKATYLLGNLYLPIKEERPYNSYHLILRLENELKKNSENIHLNRPIIASVDLRIQDKVEQLAEQFLEYYRYLGAGNISVIAVDLNKKTVLSYLGSMDYGDQKFSGSIDYADTKRSSGSVLKPFVFAHGLESGLFQTNSILMDAPLSIRGKFGVLSVNNYDNLYLGPLIYRKALANSRNVPAVQIVQKTGTESMMDLFRKLDLVGESVSGDYYGLGMAIGGLYVTLEDLINAYGTLAADGKKFNFGWFTGYRQKNDGYAVISRPVSRLIKQFLSDPQARLPSFPRLGNLEYPFMVAVKTGTSQGYRDAWTVAFNNDYLVGAWVGHPDNTSMKKVSGVAVARLVQQVLVLLEKEYPNQSSVDRFQKPEHYQLKKICAQTGRSDTKDCSQFVNEFIHNNQKEFVEENDQILIDTRTGNLANENTPAIALRLKNIPINKSEQSTAFDTLSPFKPGVLITNPLDGARYFIDPSVPGHLQSIVLRAKVKPNIPELLWFVDGIRYRNSKPPHQVRWQLQPGKHVIQARFPNADIQSQIVSIEVGY